MATEELIDDICEAFQMSRDAWYSADSRDSSDSILFYLMAIEMVRYNPFRDEELQKRVMHFLAEKLEAASERRFAELSNKLKAVLAKHEEII